MTQRSFEYGKSFPDIIVGSYVEGSLDKGISNMNELITVAGIYLGPVGNIQGTNKVFLLEDRDNSQNEDYDSLSHAR